VRRLVRYLDICDGNLEEGSMRCDANVSVRLKGAQEYGTRAEVKNMNSLRNVQRAIEFEMKRQIDLIEAGGTIVQETRSFDASNGSTFSMRSKELAHDYRYFPEPDLPPLVLSPSQIEEVRKAMPALPQELFFKYTSQLGLSAYDAGVLTENKEIAWYFESLIQHTAHYKAAANWLSGDIKSYLNANAIGIESFKLDAERLAGLIELVQSSKVSYSVAAQKVFPLLADGDARTALQIAQDMNLLIDTNENEIESIAREILAEWPEKVTEYRNGKTGLLGLFMGELMKRSKGKANPKTANEIVKNLLEK
jgi:aspartyl-tRNA(Asn)/glutamyl-tRNA(Gln) amidotransferase subunit B